MVAIKVLICCTLAAIFLAVMPVKQVDGQKCKTKWNDDLVWTENRVNYLITYNISDTKTEQTCLYLTDNYNHSSDDDNGAIVYKIDGVTFREDIEFLVDSNGQTLMIFKDPRNESIDVYFDEPVKGVGVMYACHGSEEYTLIGYEMNEPDLAASADDVANELTDGDAANFKVPDDDC